MLKKALMFNDYPKGIISEVQKKLLQKKEIEKVVKEDPIATSIIPYVSGLSESIRRILWDYGIRTAFRSVTTLGNLLTRIKDPTPELNKMGDTL